MDMKSPNIKMFHKRMGIIWDHKRKKRGVRNREGWMNFAQFETLPFGQKHYIHKT
jgi:hypothetical protein